MPVLVKEFRRKAYFIVPFDGKRVQTEILEIVHVLIESGLSQKIRPINEPDFKFLRHHLITCIREDYPACGVVRYVKDTKRKQITTGRQLYNLLDEVL